MQQQEFVKRVSERSGATQALTERVLNAAGEVVAEQLQAGDSVTHSAIGKFSVRDRAASEGRNPRTGEKIQIAAKRVVTIKPAKRLRDAVSEPERLAPRRAAGGR